MSPTASMVSVIHPIIANTFTTSIIAKMVNASFTPPSKHIAVAAVVKVAKKPKRANCAWFFVVWWVVLVFISSFKRTAADLKRL